MSQHFRCDACGDEYDSAPRIHDGTIVNGRRGGIQVHVVIMTMSDSEGLSDPPDLCGPCFARAVAQVVGIHQDANADGAS